MKGLFETPPPGVIEFEPPYYLKELATLPPDAQIEMVYPSDFPDDEADKINWDVMEAEVFRGGVQATIGHHVIDWAFNALANYEAFMTSRNVADLKRTPGKVIAMAVGNGPSLTGFFQEIPPDNVEFFCCWHALPRLLEQGIKPKYLCHLDSKVPKDLPDDIEYNGYTLIASSCSAPEFIEIGKSKGNRFHTYFNPQSMFDWFFAHQRDLEMNHASPGTVAALCVNAALYAGYNRIGLVGVDLGQGYEHYQNSMEQFPKDFQGVDFLNFGRSKLKGYKHIMKKETT